MTKSSKSFLQPLSGEQTPHSLLSNCH